MTGPPLRSHRQPGDGWVECRCGTRHWGLHGAAGLLLTRTAETGPDTGAGPSPGTRTEVVLQHRAVWSHHGGTWGIPGGALAPGESAVDGAIREAGEEAGIDPHALTVVTTTVLDHGDWSYTTVLARATGPQSPRATDRESLDVTWVGVDDVDGHDLLPAFATAWPMLRALLP